MKRTQQIILLVSYLLVFWITPDATAPLGIAVPYVIAGGGDGFAIATALLGVAGIVVSIIEAARRKDVFSLLSVALLGSSTIGFVWISKPTVVSALTAIPFAVCAAIIVTRRMNPKTKKAA